ncbi:cytochrome P450 [Westerdykella ornata]|uniref:Cytochrome P450 n=1 Tax=Westerdykella ornata TaxID=318751 RepID=A0A6A6JW16_WESOR|nr:cytochrome P450 [Westerdykella ornata]KAF2280008.1 cytochrome P450 [Westerdykella ornata]
MANGRMYIVSDPLLASQVQRASATLSFEELIVQATGRLVGISKEAAEILKDPNCKEEGRDRMVTEVIQKVIHPLLGPQAIASLASVQLQHFTEFVNSIPEGLDTELFHLLTREISAATALTFYGPRNPFAEHPELTEEFWKWETDIVPYMMNIMRPLTARKAYNAINRVSAGFEEYLEKGRQAQASELIRRRQKAHQDVGISIPDQARLEVTMTLGISVNAAISIFWLVNNICSRPALLEEIREEIRTKGLVSPNTISFSALRESCPLLNSALRETLRLIAPLATTRYVLKDTIVADTYLLRKDCIVQIAGNLIHADKQIWGPDAESFNPRRFLYTMNGSKTLDDGTVPDSKVNQIHPVAFRAFGGGSSLCPGRHFAQMEILSLTAALLMGFEFAPPKGKAKVEWDPEFDDNKFVIGAFKPRRGVDVRVKRREGMENVKWAIQF